MERVNEIIKSLDQRLSKYQLAKDAEVLTGVNKVYITMGGLIIAISILYALGGASLLLSLLGFVYPAYMSFKAMESPSTGSDTQWLTYWVVYAFFSMTEKFTNIFFSWIPMYFMVKVGFLIWLWHPSTLGANTIFNNFIKIYVIPQLKSIDTIFLSKNETEKKK